MFYRNKAAYKIGMVSPKCSLYFLVHNGNSMVNKLGVLANALSSGAAEPLEWRNLRPAWNHNEIHPKPRG